MYTYPDFVQREGSACPHEAMEARYMSALFIKTVNIPITYLLTELSPS
jgi:hypothetical protein